MLADNPMEIQGSQSILEVAAALPVPHLIGKTLIFNKISHALKRPNGGGAIHIIADELVLDGIVSANG
jgi:hypothetical protein